MVIRESLFRGKERKKKFRVVTIFNVSRFMPRNIRARRNQTSELACSDEGGVWRERVEIQQRFLRTMLSAERIAIAIVSSRWHLMDDTK